MRQIKMCPFQMCVFVALFGLCFPHQLRGTAGAAGAAPPQPQDHRGFPNLKPLTTPKQTLLASLANPRRTLLQRPNAVPKARLIQRRDVPFQQTFLGVPVQIENVKQSQEGAPAPQVYPQLPRLPPVKPLVKANETEAERAERIHKSFERLLTFVEIVGQVDNYVSSKWKNLVKTVSNFYETEEEPYRVSSKRIYGPCPHAQRD